MTTTGAARSTRGYAWCQGFENGYSFSLDKGIELRARPVRKIPLSHFNA